MIDNALQAMRRQQESESVSLLEEEDEDNVEEIIEEYNMTEEQGEITDDDILEFNEFMNGTLEKEEEDE